jgi:hypothetical protein
VALAAGVAAGAAAVASAGLFLAVLLRFNVFLERLWHFPVLGGHLREPGGQRGILYIYIHPHIIVHVKRYVLHKY